MGYLVFFWYDISLIIYNCYWIFCKVIEINGIKIKWGFLEWGICNMIV